MVTATQRQNHSHFATGCLPMLSHWGASPKNCLCSLMLRKFCDLVIRVLVYRSRDPDSIPEAIIFSEKKWVWNGVHSAPWLQLRSYLKEYRGSGLENPGSIEDPPRLSNTLYPQKLALISPTSRGRSIGIVRSWTKDTVLLLLTLFF
jgi:hypothetical protein